MRRSTRSALGALALAVTLGVAGPTNAVAAAGGGAERPSHAAAGKSAKADKGSKDKKDNKGKKGAQDLKKVLRDIVRTEARLVRLETRAARAGEHAPGVLANLAHDRAVLTELATAVQAPDNALELREVRRAVKDMRPQNYDKAINDLERALRLAAEIADAWLALEGDPAAPTGQLDAAQVALDAAVANALLITATSGKDELRAVKAHLNAVSEALGAVLDYLGESEDSEDSEDTEEEPVEEEPLEPVAP